MAKTVVNSQQAPEPIGPYSHAIKTGNLLFVSGQIAMDRGTGQLVTSSIKDETHKVMANVGAILTAAGVDFSAIVKTTIFLKDMGTFPQVNEVYGSYFKSNPPARETVEVSRLPRDVNVEISVIAAV